MATVETVDCPIKVGKHPGGMGEFEVLKATCCGIMPDGIRCMCSKADGPMREVLKPHHRLCNWSARRGLLRCGFARHIYAQAAEVGLVFRRVWKFCWHWAAMPNSINVLDVVLQKRVKAKISA